MIARYVGSKKEIFMASVGSVGSKNFSYHWTGSHRLTDCKEYRNCHQKEILQKRGQYHRLTEYHFGCCLRCCYHKEFEEISQLHHGCPSSSCFWLSVEGTRLLETRNVFTRIKTSHSSIWNYHVLQIILVIEPRGRWRGTILLGPLGRTMKKHLNFQKSFWPPRYHIVPHKAHLGLGR